MTNQEINEAVARKLGWTDLRIEKSAGLRDELVGLKNGFSDAAYPFGSTVPPYSTDIEAAWQIVGLHDGSFDVGTNIRGWTCSMQTADHKNSVSEIAETAPMAICKAFLKLEII